VVETAELADGEHPRGNNLDADVGLFDRNAHLKIVEQTLQEAQTSVAQLLLIHGGAGVGKTRILTAAGRLGREHGFQVLTSRAGPGSPGGTVARLFGGTALGNDGLDPDRTGHQHESGPHPAAEARSEFFEERLVALTAGGPLLLIVDDVHRADPESIRLLASVPWRAEHLPVAVVTTIGIGDPARDQRGLDELSANSSAESRLGPLSEEGCHRWIHTTLGTKPDPSFQSAVLRLTGGNPRLLRDLLGMLSLSGLAPTAEVADDLVKLDFSHLASALRARINRVSTDAWALARTLAAIGGEASFTELATVSGTPMCAIAEAAQALAQLGLLRQDGQDVVFAQTMVPLALVHELTFSALQSVHAQAARLLWAGGAKPRQIATHLLQSGPIGEPWASRSLHAAAAEAVRHTTRDAAGFLRRALLEPISGEERAATLIFLADVVADNNVVAATQHLREAGELKIAPPTRVRLMTRLARLLPLIHDRPDSYRAIAAVRATVRSGPDADDADQALSVLQLAAELSDVRTAGAAMGQLSRLADSVGTLSPATDRQLAAVLSRQFTWPGTDRDQALRYAHHAVATAPADDWELEPYLVAVEMLLRAGEPKHAHRYLRRISRIRQYERPLWQAATRYTRSLVNAQAGLYHDAIADARASLDLLDAVQAPRQSMVAVRNRAHLAGLLIDQRKLEEAGDLLTVDTDPYAQLDERVDRADFLFIRGRLWSATGDDEAAVVDYVACGKALEPWEITNPAVLPWRSSLARSLAAVGAREEALRHAAEEVRLARLWGAPGTIGRALHTYGVVQGGVFGTTLLTDAVAVLDRAHDPVALAQASRDLGVAMTAAGQRSTARTHLRFALRMTQQLQFPLLAEEIRNALGSAGGRLLQRPDSGVDSLTKSERNIAHMALEGRTNREIATVLFLQQRTVEIHLTNVYRKLGITGRSQLSRAFGRGPSVEGAPTG